jgi:hypothetical protein
MMLTSVPLPIVCAAVVLTALLTDRRLAGSWRFIMRLRVMRGLQSRRCACRAPWSAPDLRAEQVAQAGAAVIVRNARSDGQSSNGSPP